MAKSSRQTFRKRQRELAKKQKRENKAKRLAARRAGDTFENQAEDVGSSSVECSDEKPTLRIFPVGGDSTEPDKT